MIHTSTLYIVNDIHSSLQEMILTLPKHSTRIFQNEEEGKTDFQIEQAHKAIKEAYIADNKTKYIFLCGTSFRTEAQNALLKVLEEPPSNILFVFLTTSRNSILPTVLSRVQISYLKSKSIINTFSLNLKKFELRDLYGYLKENQRVSKNEAKNIVESILYSLHKNAIYLSHKELQSFSTAMKLLELNAKPLNVLTTLLLHIMVKK